MFENIIFKQNKTIWQMINKRIFDKKYLKRLFDTICILQKIFDKRIFDKRLFDKKIFRKNIFSKNCLKKEYSK